MNNPLHSSCFWLLDVVISFIAVPFELHLYNFSMTYVLMFKLLLQPLGFVEIFAMPELFLYSLLYSPVHKNGKSSKKEY